METGKQTTRQLTRQALDMASGWRDNLSRQAPGVASSLAESSQNAASRAREKAAQLSAQAQGMARENMSRMPQRMGTLRSSTGATWSRARKAATLAPERARWFRRGFRVGARVGAVGGVAAARVNAWRDNAPWANRPQTPTTATNTATTQPEPLVVKTTIRPRRIVLFRRQTDVPTDVTP